jgi:hypothetical protein
MRIIAYLSQKLSNLKRTSAYDYDTLTNGIFKLIRKDLSQENANLIEKYDKAMVSLSMARSTRLLHLRTLLSLSRMLEKNSDNNHLVDIKLIKTPTMMSLLSDTRGINNVLINGYPKFLGYHHGII